jgi:arabinan endo-1,5-alpha-L-arabinosidase
MQSILSKTARVTSAFFAVAGILAASGSARAVTTGANGTHDPGRMAEYDGKLYIWSTGGGGMVSSDGLAWTEGTRLGFAPWVSTFAPLNQGMWAPDEIFFNGQYFLFYSVCTQNSDAKGSCGIGLYTTPVLDPSAAGYQLTDRGMVIGSKDADPYSCFDPGPVVDTSGNLWLTWGGGAWLTRLDNTTGQVSAENTVTPGVHLLPSIRGEGTYIHYQAPYYYLFWNTGGCCDGIASTYTIHIARSTSITGPYMGANGVAAGAGGAQVFYESNGDIHGPGQIGFDTVCGTEVFTYHYYPNNMSILGVNTVTWGSDGWPVAGPQITAALKPCGGAGANGGPTDGSAQDLDGGQNLDGGPAVDTSSDAGATSDSDSAGPDASSATAIDSATGGDSAAAADDSGTSAATGPTKGDAATGGGSSEPSGSKSSGCALTMGGQSDLGGVGVQVSAFAIVAAARRRRANRSS